MAGQNSFDIEPDRIRAARSILQEENPDVLILTEAAFGQHNKYGIRLDYKILFNYPHYYYAPNGSHLGIAILSRHPIINSENYSMYHRAFVKTEIDLKGRVINVDAAHPHPDLSECEKEKFFKSCLRDMQSPYILAGDFNALSPDDSYDCNRLIRGFSRFDSKAKETVEDRLQKLALLEINKHGLIDTYIKSGKSEGAF